MKAGLIRKMAVKNLNDVNFLSCRKILQIDSLSPNFDDDDYGKKIDIILNKYKQFN